MTVQLTDHDTATVRAADGRPIDRDIYASFLQAQADLGRHDPRLRLLSGHEAEAVAGLLDELAGIYHSEGLGRLAHDLALRLYDRMAS